MNERLMPSPIERAILEDIRCKTGLEFVRIEGIDTRDRRIAESVLPVLREWVAYVTDDNHRHAVYSRFFTPHASRYVDSLIEWWQGEKYELASNCLAQALAISAKPVHAERLWTVCRSRLREPFVFMILAKLATFPSVASDVRDTLVDALLNSSLTVGDLQHVARVDDPRIRKWFEGQIDSPKRYLKALARRVVGRKKLPKDMQTSENPPDRNVELFSAEVDLSEFSLVLEQVAAGSRLKIPSRFRSATFLPALEVDRWVFAPIATEGGEPVYLWFRLEDIDVVEIVVTKDAPAEPIVQ